MLAESRLSLGEESWAVSRARFSVVDDEDIFEQEADDELMIVE